MDAKFGIRFMTTVGDIFIIPYSQGLTPADRK